QWAAWDPTTYRPDPNNPMNFGADTRSFNVTTIRYAINDKYNKTDDPHNTGIGYDMGNSSPIRSTHPGGANILFADGAVHFLRDDTYLGLLKALATRDDGLVQEAPE